MIQTTSAQKRACLLSDDFKTPFVSTLIIFLLLAAAVPAAVFASAKPGKAPPTVYVTTVTAHEYSAPREYIGHIEAIQEVELRARVSGFIEQVSFKEGGTVQAGDLLYLIEQKPYQLKVATAQARLNKSKATVKRTSQYLQRIRNAGPGSVSASAVDEAEGKHLEAVAEHAAALADLQLAELNLQYTRVTAPVSGRIGATGFTKGNLVGPESGSLAKIVQLSPIRVQYAISENDQDTINALRASVSGTADKEPFQLQLKLLDGKILQSEARIDFIDNTIDPKIGSLNVWASLDNDAEVLLPGQYVTVRVSQRVPQTTILVPQVAVLEDQDGRYVLLVEENNNVMKRNIVTSGTAEGKWVVKSGLQGGESVVVQGLQKVRPGQTVKAEQRN